MDIPDIVFYAFGTVLLFIIVVALWRANPLFGKKEPPHRPIEKQLRVTVVDQWCDTALRGSQTLHLQKRFCIVFRDEYGKTHEIPVWEEIYPVFEKGQTGILTLIDGEFYSFEADDI